MTDFEAFEKIWSIKGHAQAIVDIIKIDGVSDHKLLMLKDTIIRMTSLVNHCCEIRELK